jgi:hypothetical protein
MTACWRAVYFHSVGSTTPAQKDGHVGGGHLSSVLYSYFFVSNLGRRLMGVPRYENVESTKLSIETILDMCRLVKKTTTTDCLIQVLRYRGIQQDLSAQAWTL